MFKKTLTLSLVLVLSIFKLDAVVTSDSYGSHIAAPGVSMFGINHDGVVKVIAINQNGSSFGSGALLAGGIHVLTAGHVLKNTAISYEVTFYLPTGNITIPVDSWQRHPDYGIIPGSDIGVVTLSEKAPAIIPRYDVLQTAGLEMNVQNILFGFGRAGYGLTGKDVVDGNKRAGLNRYEATGYDRNPLNFSVNGDDSHKYIFSDFDSGSPENDAFGVHFDKEDLGFLGDEVYATNGDSGGPIFTNNGYQNVIAAIVSSGTRYPGDSSVSADVDNSINGTWGQFSVDTRLAEEGNLSFIRSFISNSLNPMGLEINYSGSSCLLFPDGGVDLSYIYATEDLVNWELFCIVDAEVAAIDVSSYLNSQLSDTKQIFFRAYTENTY